MLVAEQVGTLAAPRVGPVHPAVRASAAAPSSSRPWASSSAAGRRASRPALDIVRRLLAGETVRPTALPVREALASARPAGAGRGLDRRHAPSRAIDRAARLGDGCLADARPDARRRRARSIERYRERCAAHDRTPDGGRDPARHPRRRGRRRRRARWPARSSTAATGASTRRRAPYGGLERVAERVPRARRRWATPT